MTPGGARSGAVGRTCRVRSGGKGFGGERLWGGWCGCGWGWCGCVWGWCGRGTSRPPCPLLLLLRPPARRLGHARSPSPASAAWRGAAVWPAEAVAWSAWAAVSTPRAPSPPPSAAAAAPGDAPRSSAGATSRAGGAPGAAVGAAARLAGAAVPAPRAPGASPGAGRQGLLRGRRRGLLDLPRPLG